MIARGHSVSVAFAAFLGLGGVAEAQERQNQPTSSEGVVKDGTTCRTEMVAMRDGTRLYTEIYLPSGSETANPAKKPVVLIRTPYGGTGLPEGCFRSPVGAPKINAVVLVQSVRGTGSSEGVLNPIRDERDDGVDTIAWAARQPWSNGRVGMTSGSYLGMVQWQAAAAGPPALEVITPLVMGANPFDDWVLRNGVFDVSQNHTWAQQFVAPHLRRTMTAQGSSPEAIEAAVRAYQAKQAAAKSWIDVLPLAGDWDRQTREVAPFLWEQYSHPTYDEFWKKVDVITQVDKIVVPAMVGASWFDYFTKGTIDSYIALTARGGSNRARQQSMLTIDCCGHSPSYKTPLLPGQIDWGPNKLGYMALRDRFLQRHLSGQDNGIDSEPRVQIVVLVPPDTGTRGDTFVYKTTAWPVPGTRYENYHLSSGGRANTLHGDGVLSRVQKSSGPPDTFLYDPRNPVPAVGGGSTGAALDQTSVEQRSDVLVYTAPPVDAERLLIGKVSLKFWARTDGTDTDFTAKLVDVHPDGFSHLIVERIVRGRYRAGSQLPPKLLIPNRAYPFEMELGYTGMTLRPGHRLRLEISSSHFPKYQRNLNTGASNELTAETRIARNTVLHDARHPATLTIPVVEGWMPGSRENDDARAP